MATGKYHIQLRYDFDPLKEWKTDLRMQGMGKDFAKGAFFVLRGLAGGSIQYRLVKCNVPPHRMTPEESIEVLETYNTGKISLNATEISDNKQPKEIKCK